MKKLILISALLFSVNGWAEWTLFFGPAENGDRIYIDQSSIQKSEGYVFYWQLGDLGKPLGDIKSLALFAKVDCNTPRKRMPIQTNLYKKSMGKDLIKMVPEKQEWIYGMPGDDASIMEDYLCKYAEENLTSEQYSPSQKFNLGDLDTNQSCCKICKKGKACGNSCISKEYVCRKPPGCACNG